MIINGIDTKDISVVVQGAIDKENTPKCLKSIRKYLPEAEIILSTWEGSDVDGLDYDVLVMNEDPGNFKMSPYETNNVKRQIFSTIQGLKKSTGMYALKIRSDIALTGNNFINYFYKFNSYNEKWHFLENRIIVPSFITRDPRVWESPMCPSDWCSFGLLEDMLVLWDIPFPTEEEESWFKYHKKDAKVKKYYPVLIARYNPEQFIWINFVKKFVDNIHSEHMFDINPKSVNETLLSYANNLVILSNEQFGIKLLKERRKGSDSWHIITYNEFLKIYNKYSKGNAKTPPFDFQRLRLLKFALQSYKRLYRIASRNKSRLEFLKKEFGYFCPKFNFIFKIFNNDIKYFEYKKHDNVKISIVIPSHDNFEYLKEALDSIKNQTYKNYEIIISDDSSKKINRKKIIDELSKLYNETEINIKYIFTKKNLGQSVNTNQGLKCVEGKWVRILHSDDVLHSSCLEEEMNAIANNHDITAIYHSIIPFKDNEKLNLFSTSKAMFEELSPEFLIYNALPIHCAIPSSLLFNSELLNKIDMFNHSLKRACDWDFWARIVLHCLISNKKIIHFFPMKVFYRIHEKQNTNKLTSSLINYKEYECVHSMCVRILRQLAFPKHDVSSFELVAWGYRKKRLMKDFRNLKLYAKILLLPRFIKFLIKE